jgi:FtsX-like permease family protein
VYGAGMSIVDLGFRLAVSGGREALARLANVAATGADSPIPAGIPKTPGPGEYYASPALRRLLAATPHDQLAARYPGRDAGPIGDAALTAPDSLLIIVGGTPDRVSRLPQAKQLTSTGDNIPAIPATVVDLIMSVIVAGLLFPVLIFIGTATRLSAARREQRFAAMRLIGATPRQISVLAAIEAAAAALAGTALGFVLFLAFRGPLAAVPFTGDRFFPHDLSLSLPNILAVALGVPAGAALAAAVSLRRVRVSPLGVSRRATPRAPRWYRLLPLPLGLAELAFFLIGPMPETSDGQMAVFLPGLLLVMTGLLLAGPVLTMAGARFLARRSTRPATLIAARRLADTLRGWQQLADVTIVASLAIAGCSLAVGVVGGLTERKRPFSLLRLSGAPVRVLRRVVALESAVPMLTVAVIAVGLGLLAAQLFVEAQMGYSLEPPGPGFYAVLVAGLTACLAIIASTLPLLERITGPETARSE